MEEPSPGPFYVNSPRMHRIDEPCQVRTDDEGMPSAIHFEGKTYDVTSVEDFWRIQGRWWDGEERRTYFRVRTDGGVLEVYVEHNSRRWVLAVVHD